MKNNQKIKIDINTKITNFVKKSENNNDYKKEKIELKNVIEINLTK